jgi:hypothetical protein
MFVVATLALAAIWLMTPMQFYLRNQDLILGSAMLTLLVIAYVLNRRSYYTLAAVVATAAPEVVIFGATVLGWLDQSP